MTDASDATRCPWCSAETVQGRATCPSCGANLVESGEPAVPGLTAIDPEAVLRSVRAATAPARRNRFLSLITGEDLDEAPAVAASPAALAPPPPDVRREMLRMEIAAELADATAEAEALLAEAADSQTAGPKGAAPDAAREAADGDGSNAAARTTQPTEQPVDDPGAPQSGA